MLSPAEGEVLIARGRVVRPGRSLVVVTVDILTRRDAIERQCALMQMTLFAVDSRRTVTPKT
jgi:acyl-coenzyme A thioesterase PaaI-like protein